MRNSITNNHKRQKSIDDILEKSLSKSKVSINSGIFNKTFDSTIRKDKQSDAYKKLKNTFNAPTSVAESILDELSLDLSERDDKTTNHLINGSITRTSSNRNLLNKAEPNAMSTICFNAENGNGMMTK